MQDRKKLKATLRKRADALSLLPSSQSHSDYKTTKQSKNFQVTRSRAIDPPEKRKSDESEHGDQQKRSKNFQELSRSVGTPKKRKSSQKDHSKKKRFSADAQKLELDLRNSPKSIRSRSFPSVGGTSKVRTSAATGTEGHVSVASGLQDTFQKPTVYTHTASISRNNLLSF